MPTQTNDMGRQRRIDTEQTTLDRDEVDVPSEAYLVGVATTGERVFHVAVDHRVWVVADGAVVHEIELGPMQTITQLVAHIEDEQGWDTVYLREDSGLGGLANDLARVREHYECDDEDDETDDRQEVTA